MCGTVMQESLLSKIPLVGRGKVRDIYDLGDRLLIVATDRISCFDVVLPTPIPDKGRVLTQLSLFWFEKTGHIIRNHLLTSDLSAVITDPDELALLTGRAMVVTKAKPVLVEAIVRGYLSGSAWKEYGQHGTVCGISLPGGLCESEKLPEPMFTPSTKAERGLHDENVSFERASDLIGPELADRVRDASLGLYGFAAQLAAERGIIIADTKFEFGLVGDELILIDEVLTPDSSRFWPADQYAPGGPQPSFDKQYVRDYLDSIGFNRTPPAPELPDEVVQKTSGKYQEALKTLTGEE